MSASETEYVRMKTQKLLAVTATSGFFCLFIWYAGISGHQQPPPHPTPHHRPPHSHHNTTTKSILMWNTFFESVHFGHSVGSQLFTDYRCPVTDCRIWDMSDGRPDIPVEDFDLVWFHAWDTPAGTLLRRKPLSRKPHQVYLFYLHESPVTFPFDFRPLSGFFNWTATYRTDSDIYMPYGWFTNKTIISDEQFSRPSKAPLWMTPRYNAVNASQTSAATNKSDIAVWVVSNCVNIPSNRDVYVDELRRHVTVDVFGKCGVPCGDNCDSAMLEKKYKFYLAFENSVCGDYVTEKFFRTMQSGMVPVVYGGADYGKFAPPHSYIDAHDFESPLQLAEYLLYLDSNVTEYLKYFWWKDYYNVHQGTRHVLCDMCAKLHAAEPRPRRVVYELEEWWNAPGQCLQERPVELRTWLKRAATSPEQFLEHVFRFVLRFSWNTIVFLVLICVLVSFLVVALLKRVKRVCRVWRRKNAQNIQYQELNKIIYK